MWEDDIDDWDLNPRRPLRDRENTQYGTISRLVFLRFVIRKVLTYQFGNSIVVAYFLLSPLLRLYTTMLPSWMFLYLSTPYGKQGFPKNAKFSSSWLFIKVHSQWRPFNKDLKLIPLIQIDTLYAKWGMNFLIIYSSLVPWICLYRTRCTIGWAININCLTDFCHQNLLHKYQKPEKGN